MPDRLSALDASFLYLENAAMAMHVGSVMILEPGEGPDGLAHDSLMSLVAERIGEDSRYRQRVRELPGRIARPVWVDDVDFDLGYHVRRSALPSPGTDEQLAEFVARIQSRPLDRQHPLWEIYVVEGLTGGRTAIVTKTHQALVDGVTAVDLGYLLLDDEPSRGPHEIPEWTPRPEPSDLQLVADVVAEDLRRPLAAVERMRSGLVGGVSSMGRTALGGAGSVLMQVAKGATDPGTATALSARVRAPRRYRMIDTDLGIYRAVRDAMARSPRPVEVSVTDVALTVVTGALRAWLQFRDRPVHAGTTVRTMIPVSVGEAGRAEVDVSPSGVVACFVDLPVGETSSRVRLERIAYQLRHQMRSSQALPAASLVELAGFAPSTLHHLGARVAGAVSRRMFDLMVTNVPGPQHPLYVENARMSATYPVMPVTGGQALAIGLTSYDGRLFVGLNADRRAMTDLDVLVDGFGTSLEELVTAVGVEEGLG